MTSAVGWRSLTPESPQVSYPRVDGCSSSCSDWRRLFKRAIHDWYSSWTCRSFVSAAIHDQSEYLSVELMASDDLEANKVWIDIDLTKMNRWPLVDCHYRTPSLPRSQFSENSLHFGGAPRLEPNLSASFQWIWRSIHYLWPCAAATGASSKRGSWYFKCPFPLLERHLPNIQ